jgi:hypothetical protein
MEPKVRFTNASDLLLERRRIGESHRVSLNLGERVRLNSGGPIALVAVFQEVVHLVRTEEAEVAKLQCSTERPDEQPQECASDAQRSRGHGA